MRNRDWLAGGNLTWFGPDDDKSFKNEIYVILGIILTIVVVTMIVIVLSTIQSSGKAPAYTCNPGNPYTVAECR